MIFLSHPLIQQCMRINLIIALISITSLNMLLASPGKGQNIRQVTVDLRLEQGSLKAAFAKIERSTSFRFIYRNQEISQWKQINIPAATRTVEQTLLLLLNNTPLTFRQVDNHILIVKKEKQPEEEQPASIPQAVSRDVIISGTVTDNKGAPLAGVSVKLKGSVTGVSTGADGKFSLTLPDANGILVFSSIGYVSKDVPIRGQTVLNVSLAESARNLNEVVVVGYMTQKRSDLTGAVVSVNERSLKERPATSLSQMLAGRMAGVQVNTNSGRPGGRTNIRIRGFSSINSANNPLYIIDGVMMPIGNQVTGSQAIDYINPNDIVSVEVLKDASSTAIYGARGANGVILVTTKRGKSGTARITYDMDLSMPTAGPNRPEVLNAQEYLAIEDLAYKNMEKYDPVGWASGKFASRNPQLTRTDPRIFDGNGNPLYETDWFKEATQSKLSQNHQLGISGGNELNTYAISLGYRDDQGFLLNSYLKRFSARFTFDSRIRDWLKVGGTLSYANQAENLLDYDYSVPRQIVEDFPFLPVKYQDGTWADNNDYPMTGADYGSVHREYEIKHILNSQTLLGSFYANTSFTKELEMRTVVGTNVFTQGNSDWYGRTIAEGPRGYAAVGNKRENFWSLENYLTYSKRFAKAHSVTALLGISWQESNAYRLGNFILQGFPSDYFETNNIGAGSMVSYQSGRSRYAFNSYFGRVNYSWKDRYLLTVTGRVDGSSRFGASNRYATFPSAALAWRASEEDFLKDNPVISNLKFRVSYGVSGNSEIPPYSALSLLSSNYAAVLNNQRVSGTGINRLSNPDLRWEKTAQSDIGVELGLFNGRIALEADLYYRKTTDMLLDAPVPQTSGYATIRKNIGSMENKGIEIALSTVNIDTKDFSWSSSINISMNRNKVLSLATPSDIFNVGGPNLNTPTNVIRVGEPVGSFYGLVRLGVWSEAERTEAAQYTSYRSGLTILPGDIKYLDVNGDHAINDADRMIIGNGSPKAWGGFTNTFRYKNLDLTLELQYSYGNDVLDLSLSSSEDRVAIANSYRSVLNAWTPENQNTMIPEVRDTRAGYISNPDSHWVRDGSFVRGKNLLLGYTLPVDISEKIRLNRCRIYFSVQNFFLLTGSDIYGDPETVGILGNDGSNVFSQGTMWHGYPKPRTWMLGLNIGF